MTINATKPMILDISISKWLGSIKKNVNMIDLKGFLKESNANYIAGVMGCK